MTSMCNRAAAMTNRIFGALLALAVAGCGGGSGTSGGVSTLAPLHDVYEATNVALPDGSGNGSIVFAFSENGVAGSNVSGEIVLVAASHMTRLPLQAGSVTRAGSTGTIQAAAVNTSMNRTTSVSGTFASSALTYTLNGSTMTTGTAARIESYVDNNADFVPPSGFLGTLTYVPETTSCANGSVYVAISGAQPDGYGLWRPVGAVSISTPPSLPYSANDGVWDSNDVFVLIDLSGNTIGPSTPTLAVTLTAFPSPGTNGGVAQFGATPCSAPIQPVP
jgi:hypothetical protein